MSILKKGQHLSFFFSNKPWWWYDDNEFYFSSHTKTLWTEKDQCVKSIVVVVIQPK